MTDAVDIQRLEEILKALNFTTRLCASAASLEEVFPEILRQFGKATQVSRTYFAQIRRTVDGYFFDNHYIEWIDPEIQASICDIEERSLILQKNGFKHWAECLSKGQPVYYRISDLSDCDPSTLLETQVLSVCIFPLISDQGWWGCLGFDDYLVERTWSEFELEIIECVSKVISNCAERQKVEHKLNQRIEELTNLHDVSVEISAPHELSDLLSTIVERATILLKGTGGGLYLCDREFQEVSCVVSYKTPQDYTGIVLQFGEGAAGTIAQTGKPLIIDDYRNWGGRAKSYEENQPFRSVIGAPMIWQNQVLGVLHVLHDQNIGQFTQKDLSLLSSFANQAAIALHNANMFKEAQERAHRLSVLNAITFGSLEIKDETMLLQFLADRLGELINANGCYITLWDEHLKVTRPVAAYGPYRDEYRQFKVPEGELTITESVIRAGHPLVVEDTHESNHLSPKIAALFPARSLLALPLIVGDQKLGAVLIAFNHFHKFSEDEISICEQSAAQISLALLKTRMLDTERRRVNELEALQSTVKDISSELDLESLLSAILERATSLLNATGGDLGLYLEETGEIQIVVSHNMGKDYTGTCMAIGEGAMGKAIETLQPVVVEDYDNWENSSPQYLDFRWHGVIAVPLTFGNRLVGTIGLVDSNPDRKFTSKDVGLLTLFGQHAAIAIENARLYNNEKRRAEEIALIFEINSTLTESLDLDTVLQKAVDSLGRTAGATSAYILTCDLNSGLAEVVVEHYSPDANPKELVPDIHGRFDLNDYPKTLNCLRSGQVCYSYLSDPDISPIWREEMETFGVKCSLDIPITISGRTLGYVEIWDSRHERTWSQAEINLFRTLANQVAVAIENARLFNNVQTMAITDALTKLYNRRGLFEVGQREVDCTNRIVQPFSVLMIDIDHFKSINDTHNHAIGDQVLKGLASLCQTHMRKMDILGRYGGEEFAVFLPQTDLHQAYLVADRLRANVERTPIETDHGPISITISIGVTILEEENTDLEALIERADTAMYEAKQAGRNRVIAI